MSNEVVNPFQTYRDDRGAVLAGGSLRILQPGTSSLGTAFSDSALTIPQVVDGYGLDNFGRVQGNLRWAGLRDVEVFGAGSPAPFIRTDPDVVTLIDSSAFAINFPSVAAMIADTTLVDGDVAETQSYNLDQREGGARYIVTTSALSVDSYRVHTLAPAGLQAQLLDEEANKNFYVAGAIGDGTANDSTPVQRLLDIGGDIECANGTFAASALTSSLSFRLWGNGTLLRFAFSNLDLITLTGINLFITFDGVLMDGNLANQSAEQAIAMVRSSVTASAGSTISLVTFNNVQFQNGSQNDVVGIGDDTGFPVLYTFSQCDFLGGEEGQADGTFDVASVLMTEGANCAIEDCYFSLQATPVVGRPGVVTSNSTFVNPGVLSVTASTFNLMGMDATTLTDSLAAIHAREVANLIITGNRLLGPVGGGIVFGAEVDTVTIAKNLVDALTVTNGAYGGIAALVTTAAVPGDNWQIDDNQIINCAVEAININGASAGNDAANLQIQGNIINGSTLQAVLFHNITNLQIEANQIDMESIAGVIAILENTDGVSGQVSISANEISNVDNWCIQAAVTSAAAIFTLDGNQLDASVNGFSVLDKLDAYITNNVLTGITAQIGEIGTLTRCTVDGNSEDGTAVTFLTRNGAITDLIVGENFWPQLDSSITQIAITGANITTGPVEAHFHVFVPTGATTIDTLTDPGVDGFVVVLQSTGAADVTFNDALGNMNLGAATRLLDVAQDTLTLVWNQLNSEWNELGFSSN